MPKWSYPHRSNTRIFTTRILQPDIYGSYPVYSRHWIDVVFRIKGPVIEVAERITIGFIQPVKYIIDLEYQADFPEYFFCQRIAQPEVLRIECGQASILIGSVIQVLPAYIFADQGYVSIFHRYDGSRCAAYNGRSK